MKHLIVIYPNCAGLVAFPDDYEIPLETLQGFVRGSIETIPTFHKNHVLIVNEENKFVEPRIPNMRATRILSPFIKDVIFGNALIMEVKGEELVGLGEETAAKWMEILQ